MYVSVLRFKPSFPPIISVRAVSSVLERYKLCGHETRTQKLHCNAVSRVETAMPCDRTGYDKHDVYIRVEKEKEQQ